MSLDATIWAWKQKVKPSQKLVLLSLADRANEQHICFPSIRRLTADTCLNRQTIMEAIKKLSESGLVEVERATGKGNRYRLIGVKERHDQSEKTYGSENRNRSEKANLNQSENSYRDQSEKPDTEPTNQSLKEPPTKPRAGNSLERLSELKLLPSTINDAKVLFPEHDVELIADRWREWVRYRATEQGSKAFPRYPDKAYLAWARKFVENNKPEGTSTGGASQKPISVPAISTKMVEDCQVSLNRLAEVDEAIGPLLSTIGFFSHSEFGLGMIRMVALDEVIKEQASKNQHLMGEIKKAFSVRYVEWSVSFDHFNLLAVKDRLGRSNSDGCKG